jgi:predicted CopG family antitoxin
MSKRVYKTITVSKQTYEDLAQMGTLNDTFDKTIQRLIKNTRLQEITQSRTGAEI